MLYDDDHQMCIRDRVNTIAEVRTDYSDRPMNEQKIKSITAETFWETYPEPEKC